jgi:hypothetical protein
MIKVIKMFRKHRKVLIAGLTLMAILAFVFIPMMMDRGANRQVNNPVVVTSARYGQLRQSDLQNLRQQRGLYTQFLEFIARQAATQRGDWSCLKRAQGALENNPTSEASLVNHWLLVHWAQETGMRFDDAAVNSFIRTLTSDKIPGDQIRAFVRDHKTTLPIFFQVLQEEMGALLATELFQQSLTGFTPEAVYEYFLRTKRSATIEAVAFPIENYVAQTPEPTPGQLMEFFETYKDKAFNPNSPLPGLREPHKIRVQYFKTNREKFLKEAEATITDAEIRDFYEKNKDAWFKELPEMKQEPAKPAAKTPEPAKPEDKKPDAKKAEPPKPEAPKTETPKPEAPKTDVKPAAEAPKPQPAQPAGKAPEKKSSSHRAPSPFRLVAFEDSTPKPPASPAKTDAVKSEPAKVEPAKVEPAKPEPAKPEAPKTGPAASKPGDAKAESPKLDKTPAAKTEPPKYKPFESVKDEIRKQLAARKAFEKMQRVLEQAQARVYDYRTEYSSYEATEEPKKKDATPPTAPDFKAMANEAGLELVETNKPFAEWESQGVEGIGSSYNSERRRGFGQSAFDRNLHLYEPLITIDMLGNGYVFWKCEDLKAHVPDWDTADAQEKATKAWKRIQARDLAEKAAKQLADDARAAKKSLKDFAAGRKDLKVITPAPFTWMTMNPMAFSRGGIPVYPTQIPGIEAVGPTFYRQVFGLKAGELTTAWNMAKSQVYAVQLTSYSPMESSLWAEFISSRPEMSMMSAQWDLAEMSNAWQDWLYQYAGLKWEREPEQANGNEGGE